jgi:hypothetical protein
MPGSTAYSSLETLLLFQYLRAYGISPTVFSKISEQLKDHPQIRESNGFDAGRLSPDALREFFLRIWKEELRREERPAVDVDAPNGAASSSPRKRKAPSPSLPTIQDAAENTDLLPKVVVKLYGRYREETVREIRETETKHGKLLQEVIEIKRGDWDVKLQESLDHTQRNQAQSLPRPNGNARVSVSSAGKSTGGLLRPGFDRREQITRSPSPSSTTIELPKTVPRHLLASHQSPSTPAAGNRNPLPTAAQSQATIAPSPYRGSPVATTQTQYAQRLVTDRSASPLNPQSPSTQPPGIQTSIAQNHASPGIGTQAKNTTLPQLSPSYPQMAGQPQSPASGPLVTPPGYSPSGRPSGPQYSASSHGLPRGGVMLQPFQVAPQVPTPLQQQQSGVQGQAAAQTRTLPRMVTAQSDLVSTPQSGRQTPGPDPLILSISKMLATPSLANTPVQSPITAKRTADTKWRALPSEAVPSSPTRPGSRDVSPISDREHSPEPVESRETRKRGVRTRKVASHDTPDSVATHTRSGRQPSRRTRGVSATSSAIDSSARGRTRSQSVTSHGSPDHVFKPEPSTPNVSSDVAMAEDTAMAAPSAANRRSTRNKRKRSVTATSELGDAGDLGDSARPHFPQPIERDSVFAVRNFPRLSNTVMNDITSHRHASLFSNPVRDRDAEGYSTMIRRPTDLKSIKAAIAAGNKAVNAANVTVDSTSSGVSLPWSEDLIPPKAIANSAQLEREIMRMLANAVMFNPGEDDVVADAREMFESAEASLVNFRSAEKTVEASTSALKRRGESEMSQGQEEDEKEGSVPTTTGKRRRVA